MRAEHALLRRMRLSGVPRAVRPMAVPHFFASAEPRSIGAAVVTDVVEVSGDVRAARRLHRRA